MSICVILQRNHDYAEQIRRYKKMVCKGKTFTHHPMRICVSVYFLKKSQPKQWRNISIHLECFTADKRGVGVSVRAHSEGERNPGSAL